MISDDELYSLAIFLGSAAMLMIVLYHFLEANSVEDVDAKTGAPVATATSGSKAKSAIQ
jgi:oligosaccharyl transferase complex subunit OST4